MAGKSFDWPSNEAAPFVSPCALTLGQPYASSSRRRVRYAVSAVLPASSMALSYAVRDSRLRPSRRSKSAWVAWNA